MLLSRVFVKRISRSSVVPFLCQIPIPSSLSPKSHGIKSFTDPHPLNPCATIFYKNIGGRGCDSHPMLGTSKNPSRIHLSFQPFARCPSRNSFSLRILHFHGGVYTYPLPLLKSPTSAILEGQK